MLFRSCVNEMGVTIDNQDDENFLIDCHNHDKIIRISAQEIDSETTQVIIDARKSRLQVYSWKREDIEVNLFYELFEKKLCEYKAFILCPGCSAKVSSLAKFCPECGIPLK